MIPLVIAAQLTPGEGLGVLLFVALIVVGTLRRRSRRATMTPTELALDDLREETAKLRREVRRRRLNDD